MWDEKEVGGLSDPKMLNQLAWHDLNYKEKEVIELQWNVETMNEIGGSPVKIDGFDFTGWHHG